MSSLDNLSQDQDEDATSSMEEDGWTLAGQSQPLADNPYPMTVPSGDAMQYDQHPILAQSAVATPAPSPQSDSVENTFEIIGGILEILGSILELFE